MRKWNKYRLVARAPGESASVSHLPVDQEHHSHIATMGGYAIADESYENRDKFFDAHFHRLRQSRFGDYDDFLSRHLEPGKETLSIASGRCANELWLNERGFHITCSEMTVVPSHLKTREIFPDFKIIPLNVLEGPPAQRFDAVICLGLIYVFDNAQLDTFFDTVAATLNPHGVLLLDSAGSPDNFLSNAVHDHWLRLEAVGIQQLKRLFPKRPQLSIVVKHHGYRRADAEILRSAERAGFSCLVQENYAFLAEFQRSVLLSQLLRHSRIAAKCLTYLGRRFPYVRMFKFVKKPGR